MKRMHPTDPSKPTPGYVMRPTLRKALEESIARNGEALRMLAKK